MSKIQTLISEDNREVKIEGYRWKMPTNSNSRSGDTQVIYRINWDQYPHPDIVEGIARLILEEIGTSVVLHFHYGLNWVYRFLLEVGKENTVFYTLTETEWGAFGKWLEGQVSDMTGKILSLNTRRGYYIGLKAGLELAADEEVYGVSWDDVEAIEEGMRRRFRDVNLMGIKRASERAWDYDERDALMKIIRDEWLAWKDWNTKRDDLCPDLLAVAATYLCFEETLRPAEINVMEVKDIQFGANTTIHVHAPNKEEGFVEISKIATVILKALIEYGKDSRKNLDTDYLFVDPEASKKIGSQELNHRLRRLLVKYHSKYPINDRNDVVLSDGRKTLGARLASEYQDEEMVRVAMRHATVDTTKIYYVRHSKAQHSKNVSKAIENYATRISMAYNEPLFDPKVEGSERVKDILERNPFNEKNPYGACTSDIQKEGDCERGIHCGDCYMLIPMVSKLDNYIAERDLARMQAEEEEDDRSRENLIAHAAMLEAHIQNIYRKMEKAGLSYAK